MAIIFLAEANCKSVGYARGNYVFPCTMCKEYFVYRVPRFGGQTAYYT